ncbi:Prephenate dehydratase [Corynebacterium kutscheri]|uniref:Prephenate dehydratase n=1 Tax=Corynebacterium kutscheri TaxID=35755 RepID=A0A0F6R1Y8_9CORY|nr:prephenate dehydratase [Corynebacterium kutscheri]AKE42150.1 prephenate dehydratase [Corynebacterium kutscheri]VEH05879.1 Prephenate dehydratase [Corynebacterium kutscheri]VEH10493.1 Prephenate dehydratase [Corynebacterium kutscheri]VEH81770.1 Prephenate dehydratase [Corynebacterium kutscheri]
MSVVVAYLGPEGTFTEAAMQKFIHRGSFGDKDIQALPLKTPYEAIETVRQGTADFACVAIENSVDGFVTPAYDALAAGCGVQIYDELDLPIAFTVMKSPGKPIGENPVVTTHPVAHQQVKKWLRDNIGSYEFSPAPSNAQAAIEVAQGRADIAAAPRLAAHKYGLEIIEDQVADVVGARTRFVVVSTAGRPAPRSGTDRTAVVFILPNKPGSLVSALNEFSLRGVDLSRIESRPIAQGLGDYRFHVEFNGHIDDLPVAEALRALYMHCEQVHFLGSWPADNANAREKELERDDYRLQQADRWVRSIREGKPDSEKDR